MRMPVVLRPLSAAALIAAAPWAAAQSAPAHAAPPPAPATPDTATQATDPATDTTRIDVDRDVTLFTRVVDPALVEASRAFDALDADGDGTLTSAEAAAGPPLADPFERIDADGNGRLDRDEYTAQRRR